MQFNFDEAIFKFYFFDGEKLRDFFTESQANSIQQSIFNISQVTLLETAETHLAKLNSDRAKKVAKGAPDVGALGGDREKQENKLKKCSSNIKASNRRDSGGCARKRTA